MAKTMNEYTSIKTLKKSLKRWMKTIRSVYLDISRGVIINEKGKITREWLCDNYYLIDREWNNIIKGIDNIDRLPYGNNGQPYIYSLACEYIDSVKSVNTESVISYLENVQNNHSLSNVELFVFRDMISVAAIEKISEICLLVATDKETDSNKISAYIEAIRAVPGIDLSESFERISETERKLLSDPAGVYRDMSDETKEYYRKCITQGAKKSAISEIEFANLALNKAESSSGRERHIGFHIVPDERKTCGVIFVALYFVLPIIAAFISYFITRNIAVSLISTVPIWAILKAIEENVTASLLKPKLICSMNPKTLSDESRAIVVMACLISSSDEIKRLAKNIRQVHLSGVGVRCGLLGDFKESSTLTKPEDSNLLTVLEKEIKKLNDEFGGGFFAVVRKRRFSSSEEKYMGYERKRGAICEFVSYIKNGKSDFRSITGDLKGVVGSKYLLTLDADTEISLDSVGELTAVLEHPFNKAVVIDNAVKYGYGIAVPKLTTDIDSSSKSPFSRMFAGIGGLHSYGGSGGDFFQDLFGQGLFTGKGLINVDAFSAVYSDAFPDGKILSHDIIEGACLKTCVVSSTEFSDSFPTTVKSWLTRHARWIRGDFQNAFLLFENRSNSSGDIIDNKLGYSEKYKMFENIRRGITPIFILASIILAVLLKVDNSLMLLFLLLASVASPEIVSTIRGIFKPRIVFRRYITRGVPAFLGGCARILINIIMLPKVAAITIREVSKVIWRSVFSHRNMLEWVTAAQAESNKRNRLIDYYSFFWPNLIMGILLLFLGSILYKVLGVIWLIAPLVLCEISRPDAEPKSELSDEDEEFLYSFAASIWRYFERYVGDDSNHLPPDNVQYSPYNVAMRTSPTNIGLYLLCVLAARDLRFIDTEGMVKRLSASFSSISKLETWNGNLYNWYDINTLKPMNPGYISTVDSGNYLCCLTALKEGIAEYAWESREINSLVKICERIIDNTDISKLYNNQKRLFHIGYDVAKNRFGNNYYDMFMSEARMTGYYAIAKKVADKRHWGMLGRLYAECKGYVGPVSWSGTMFEYFMPHLLMPIIDNSMSDEALHYALFCQKRRTAKRDLPWGVSESGFSSLDLNRNYQYKAFGVQKIGLKNGLDDELVISPYSTFLVLPFAKEDAIKNLKRLINMGMNGEFGLYEAVDFTVSRTGGGFTIVKSYMAHHMGMSMVSLTNCLLGNVMQKRFMRDSDMRSAQNLLEEAVYESVSIYKGADKSYDKRKLNRHSENSIIHTDFSTFDPRAQVISNGEFSTVVTDGGSGFSMWNGMDLSSRNRDLTITPCGVYVLVKEDDNQPFSITADPIRDGVSRKAEFSSSAVSFTALKDSLEAAMGIGVHGRIPAEIRQIKVANVDSHKKEIQILFYLEPVIQKYSVHMEHPAYSDLFIQSEYCEAERCLLVWRRGGSGEEACVAYGFVDFDTTYEFETDRSEVLKKGKGTKSLDDAFSVDFSSSSGTPVIPCVAIRTQLSVKGGESKKLMFIQVAGRNRDEALSRFMIIRRQGMSSALKSTWETTDEISFKLNYNNRVNRVVYDILPRVCFDCKKQVESAFAARENVMGRSDLWSVGISGDLPVVVCEFDDDFEKVEAHIDAHTICGLKSVEYDLCVLYSEGGEYNGYKKTMLTNLVQSRGYSKGVYLLDIDVIGNELANLFRAVSVYCDSNTVISKSFPHKGTPIKILSTNPSIQTERIISYVPGGGFESDSFVSYPQKSSSSLPWCFPIANHNFGTLVSNGSIGFSYFKNSRLNQMSPWSNDYITDNIGEKLTLEYNGKYYDLASNAFVRFGRGYTEYHSSTEGLSLAVTVSVHKSFPVKMISVRITNKDAVAKKIKFGLYIDPLPSRGAGSALKSSINAGVLLVTNPLNDDYPDMYCGVSSSENSVFITEKEAYYSGEWERQQNEYVDCAACVTDVQVDKLSERDVVFYLSMSRGKKAAIYPHIKLREKHYELSNYAIGVSADNKINTPSENINRLINLYVPYQAEVARIRARTGFSQNSGGFGFRDQLQDVCATVMFNPEETKRHILKASSMQFVEGDVLHWWHRLPKDGGGLKGVRTRCSDDLFWLPYSVARYIDVTGDKSILELNINFLQGEKLEAGESERYISPKVAECGTVLEHCKRAMDYGLRIGEHGLMLFGSGDWNDGMNRVGIRGKGESVWLSMFVVNVLNSFAEIVLETDADYSEKLIHLSDDLKLAIENAWEKDRYIRGYHDDGSVIGSASSDECKIDGITQSFSAFCGCDSVRSKSAVETAYKELVVKSRNLVRLFTPPFSLTQKSIGYIKHYPTGIRENGGQYTHGAVWLARAALKVGLKDSGAEILEMISPITHCFDANYKAEPYFIAADIYSCESCLGRGGWTIYTGAASWYYRTVIEDLLGIKKKGDRLYISPSVPSGWSGYEADLYLDNTKVHIKAQNSDVDSLRVNGEVCEYVPLKGGEICAEIKYR